MPSDQRWTGGAANRTWQSGTRPGPVVDVDAITVQVRRYLRDCERFRPIIRAADHPTEDGALKVVFHQGDTQKRAVLAVFRQLTERHAAQPS